MKIAFLDRDGTIIKDYPDEKWAMIKQPQFLDGSIAGMKKLIENGYYIIIITNQYLINDGIITLDQYQQFTQEFLSICQNNNINILKIYFCPHNDQNHCNCKKPKPGIINQALAEYNIDLNNSIYCGDSEADYLLAKHFNLPFCAISSPLNYPDIIKCDSILDVCQHLKLT